MPIPDGFNSDGVLEVGTYEATVEQIRTSILVSGPGDAKQRSWDRGHRLRLLDNAEKLVDQLRSVGITEIFLDGSFVESKPRPNDIDGYFECTIDDLASDNLVRRLNKIDLFKVWTWDPYCRGLLSGITDRFGNELQFPAAFRLQRGSGIRKGIIKVVLTRTTRGSP